MPLLLVYGLDVLCIHCIRGHPIDVVVHVSHYMDAFCVSDIRPAGEVKAGGGENRSTNSFHTQFYSCKCIYTTAKNTVLHE